MLQTGINPVDDPDRFGSNQHQSNKLISAKDYLQLAKGDLSRCVDILVNFQQSLQQYAKIKRDPSKSYNPLALLRRTFDLQESYDVVWTSHALSRLHLDVVNIIQQALIASSAHAYMSSVS